MVTVALVTACATIQNRWEAAKSADTITAYEQFLKEYPDGDLADQARLRRGELSEERDWRSAAAIDSVDAYEDFIKNYPKGRYSHDAHERRELLSLLNISNEKILKRYQQGVFMDEARITLEKLSFDQAMAGNTVSAYEGFLKRYPVGKLADEAARRIEKLSFEQAQSEDTVQAYDGYLDRYPDGAFADDARSRRDKLYTIHAAPEWGKIMYPKSRTNIREKRSATSRLKGQLRTDQPVKVDFLRDAWYAVFPVTQKQRNEKMALGYVYAPLLMDKGGAGRSGTTASKEESAKDPSLLRKMETGNLPVDVKSITFKVAADGNELLFIGFDRFYTPSISGINGKEPRIILEIKNALPLREDWAAIHTGGNYLREIRSSMDPQTGSARISLEMAPEKSYFVSQAFYKKDNMYVLEITDKKEIPLP